MLRWFVSFRSPCRVLRSVDMTDGAPSPGKLPVVTVARIPAGWATRGHWLWSLSELQNPADYNWLHQDDEVVLSCVFSKKFVVVFCWRKWNFACIRLTVTHSVKPHGKLVECCFTSTETVGPPEQPPPLSHSSWALRMESVRRQWDVQLTNQLPRLKLISYHMTSTRPMGKGDSCSANRDDQHG